MMFYSTQKKKAFKGNSITNNHLPAHYVLLKRNVAVDRKHNNPLRKYYTILNDPVRFQAYISYLCNHSSRTATQQQNQLQRFY